MPTASQFYRTPTAGKPQAPFPIDAKSRTSSDIMKHASQAFKHLPPESYDHASPSARGRSTSSPASSSPHFRIQAPHAVNRSPYRTPAPRAGATTTLVPVAPHSSGESIVDQLLSLTELKKANCLTDREFALAKWQVLGLAQRLENGETTHRDVHTVNTFSNSNSSATTARNRSVSFADSTAGLSSSQRRSPPQEQRYAHIHSNSGSSSSSSSSSQRQQLQPHQQYQPTTSVPLPHPALMNAATPKQTLLRVQQLHNDAVRSSPKPLYAHHYNKVHVSVPSARLGQRVTVVRQKGAPVSGVVRFTGLTKFAPGTWVGVELDLPEGRNNGSLNGMQYFDCKFNHGLFVRPDAVYAEEDILTAGTTALKWIQDGDDGGGGGDVVDEQPPVDDRVGGWLEDFVLERVVGCGLWGPRR
jgi:hypothetical protein